MFGKLDLTKDIKIPKGVVMMMKSLGLDAKELEQNLFGMGKQAIKLIEDADQRLCSLANQHQLLHEANIKLQAEIQSLHAKLDRLMGTTTFHVIEESKPNGDANCNS